VKTETDWGSGRGGCPVALLVFLGVVCGLVMVGYCGATAATYPALLLALPRRVLAGWSCSCGTYNDERVGTCAGCGKGRS
jgi:hypothetical protein